MAPDGNGRPAPFGTLHALFFQPHGKPRKKTRAPGRGEDQSGQPISARQVCLRAARMQRRDDGLADGQWPFGLPSVAEKALWRAVQQLLRQGLSQIIRVRDRATQLARDGLAAVGAQDFAAQM